MKLRTGKGDIPSPVSLYLDYWLPQSMWGNWAICKIRDLWEKFIKMSRSETKNSQENPNKDAGVKMILISLKNRINFHLDEFLKKWVLEKLVLQH